MVGMSCISGRSCCCIPNRWANSFISSFIHWYWSYDIYVLLSSSYIQCLSVGFTDFGKQFYFFHWDILLMIVCLHIRIWFKNTSLDEKTLFRHYSKKYKELESDGFIEYKFSVKVLSKKKPNRTVSDFISMYTLISFA